MARDHRAARAPHETPWRSRSRELAQLSARLERGREDDELLPAPARDRVEAAQRMPQARGDLDEDGVAGDVSERVVDELEVVDVDEQDPGRQRVGARALELGVEHLGEVAPVEDGGQRVRTRGLLQQLLGVHLGGRVAHDALDDQAISVAPRAATAADPARHAVEADEAAEHLAHLAAQVARGVLGVERAIVGVDGLDPRPAPVAVLGHAPEQTVATRARRRSRAGRRPAGSR